MKIQEIEKTQQSLFEQSAFSNYYSGKRKKRKLIFISSNITG